LVVPIGVFDIYRNITIKLVEHASLFENIFQHGRVMGVPQHADLSGTDQTPISLLARARPFASLCPDRTFRSR
jgi:hypothetical protein